MAEALNSEYEWGVTPRNIGNLNAQQLSGLASLAPQSGIGLLTPRSPAPLSPFSQLPTPNFTDPAAFKFTPQDIAVRINPATGMGPVTGGMTAPTPNVTPSGAPYFDPNYPYESMLALKNYLAPQIASAVPATEAARGLGYSGVGQYANADAQNYLAQLAPPGETGQQALENDFAYLYGPEIGDSLASGSSVANPGGAWGVAQVPASIPGAAPAGGNPSNEGALLVPNPGYGGAAGRYGVPENEPVGGSSPYAPQFGLYDVRTGGSFETPGYFYNADAMPNAASMPWLKPATPYSPPPSPTAKQLNV